MITSILKKILIDSGCTLVLYEQDKLANILTDQSKQYDIVGLIIQPNSIKLEVKANSIIEHYNPLTIEIMQQVRLEDTADNNEVKLEALKDKCKVIILRIISSGYFKTILPVEILKILETKYDANVVGWAIPFDLYYLKNENKNPCL
jgi:hypothetical protein